MPKKAKPELVHRVSGNLKLVELTKAGSALELEIFDADGKLGTIIIGQGSFSWRGRHRKGKKTWQWSQFAKKLDELADND